MRRAWMAVAFVTGLTLLVAPAAFAQAAAQPAAPSAPATPKFVAPIKGVLEVGQRQPTVTVTAVAMVAVAVAAVTRALHLISIAQILFADHQCCTMLVTQVL